VSVAAASAVTTVLPALEAHEPPEARGLARDGVRLMVAERATATIAHRRFDELGDLLSPGDLLVVNTSATLPAALDAAGLPLQVRFSTTAPHLPSGWHVVEIRTGGGAAPAPPGSSPRPSRRARACGLRASSCPARRRRSRAT
jgi:S-adenosylmethionine:tRNA ribosyltransferase-isomerase